jgi:hypothetical protein
MVALGCQAYTYYFSFMEEVQDMSGADWQQQFFLCRHLLLLNNGLRLGISLLMLLTCMALSSSLQRSYLASLTSLCGQSEPPESSVSLLCSASEDL